MQETNFVRPMTLREIFRGSFVLYRRHFWTFLAITLVYTLLYYPLNTLINWTVPESGEELANILISPILNFAYAATVIAASNAALGRPVKLLDSYRRVLTPRILLIMVVFGLPFQLVSFLYGEIYAAAVPAGERLTFAENLVDFFALPLVSVAVHTLLIFRAQVTVLEKRGLWDTIRRVVRLSLENFNRKLLVTTFIWKLFYFWLVLWIPFILVTPPVLIYVLLTGSQPSDAAIWIGLQIPAALFELFVSPYGLLLSILLYYDVRARKEAYNQMVLAEEMGYQPITELITV